MENATRFPTSLQRIWCSAMGHRIDHLRERNIRGRPGVCLCGERILERHKSTHIGHVFGCARHGHSLRRLRERPQGTEYVCQRCAHPMFFAGISRSRSTEKKPIDWACGMRGHRVKAISVWQGFVEHACACGHPFLLDAAAVTVRHPMSCVLMGHVVRRIGPRGRFDVFRCERCGHPFYFHGKVATTLSHRPGRE